MPDLSAWLRYGCERRIDQRREFDVVETPSGEEAAPNALRVNDLVFVGHRFLRTIELLDRRGYRVVPLEVTEIGKIDAGLSCMSLRWRQA